MNKVSVVLESTEDKEWLVLQFGSPIKLDLTSDSSEDLKKFFVNLLNIIKDEPVELNFNDNGRADLYSDVAAKYVKDLNSELSAIQTSFPKEVL